MVGTPLTNRFSDRVFGRHSISLPTELRLRLLQHEADRHEGDAAMPQAELLARISGKQAIVSMVTTSIDRAVIEAGRDLKVIANVILLAGSSTPCFSTKPERASTCSDAAWTR